MEQEDLSGAGQETSKIPNSDFTLPAYGALRDSTASTHLLRPCFRTKRIGSHVCIQCAICDAACGKDDVAPGYDLGEGRQHVLGE